MYVNRFILIRKKLKYLNGVSLKMALELTITRIQ